MQTKFPKLLICSDDNRHAAKNSKKIWRMAIRPPKKIRSDQPIRLPKKGILLLALQFCMINHKGCVIPNHSHPSWLSTNVGVSIRVLQLIGLTEAGHICPCVVDGLEIDT